MKRLCPPNGCLNSSDIETLISTNGFYTDGLGNIKKLPSNIIDVGLIVKAIHKRIRKSLRNLSIGENK